MEEEEERNRQIFFVVWMDIRQICFDDQHLMKNT